MACVFRFPSPQMRDEHSAKIVFFLIVMKNLCNILVIYCNNMSIFVLKYTKLW
jgi:hypothetical protein